VIAVAAFAALGGFLFLSTLYLQNVRGLDALHAGLWMLPMAVPTFLCAPLSGRLVGARGPRLPLLVAGTAMTASGVLFAAFEAETGNATLLLGYALFGIGFGFVNAPITNTAVSGMPRTQAGVAAAVASTSRQLGQTLGVAVVGAVLASGIGSSPYRQAFVPAARPGWWILTGCGLAVLVLGLLTSGRWARRTAERTAGELETAEARPSVGAAERA
jgi:MFS family permease